MCSEWTDGTEEPQVGNGEVKRPVPPARGRPVSGQVLEEQQPWIEPSREERAHLSERGGQPVALLEREGAADDRRLLAAAVIKVAEHMTLLEQMLESLLEPTAQNEVSEQSSELFTRQ